MEKSEREREQREQDRQDGKEVEAEVCLVFRISETTIEACLLT